MSEITITVDVLSSEKPTRFHENSTPIVKPNSLPLNEINMPSFRDISPFSTSPNNPAVNDCATSSNFYQDVNDTFGNLNVNEFHADVQLQRLQQKQILMRQSNDATEFSSPLMKTKLSSQEDVRHFVDQNHSPFKAVQTSSNPASHLHSPFYDQQQTIRSLLTDNQQFQTTYNSIPAYSNFTSNDAMHDLNALSGYYTNRVHPRESSMSHISPCIEELNSFPKHSDGTPAAKVEIGSFGSSFITSSGENDGLKMIPPLKVSDFNETSVNNFSANSHLNEALLLKLRQQNSMSAKLLPQNVIDPGQYGSVKKDFMLRQSMTNLTPFDTERITKLYLNELIRENPSLLTTHLLSMPIASLQLPFNMSSNHIESYSRKVFVGGLPPDSDEDEITASFRQFGPLIVDWPHKAETKTNFPPKGYCFLLFQDEMSVQNLIDACIQDDGKYYWCITCTAQKDKPVRRVQIRPWCLVDSDFVMDGSQPLDLRKTIFVGGVPRPLRAVELALAMERLYGGVCYAGIDTDPELKYPKGAGRVSFSNQQSYIAAISARFVQLQLGDIDKRVEVKPYVLDDQLCDECQGQKCAGKSAPYFCANVACLQYYCEICWVQIHSRPGREYHKPLVKEGADRPKSIPPFKW